MALPSTNLSFSDCTIAIGNSAPLSNDDLEADILFGDDWTQNNALGIKGYGQQQTSGNNRIANLPTGSAISLSDYLGLIVVGSDDNIGNNNPSYWTYWDNQLTGGNDIFFNLYFRLWDYYTTNQLVNQYLNDLYSTTTNGPTTLGLDKPLVQYAFWQVEFYVDKPNTNPFTFELLCSIDDGANYNSILTVNQTWAQGTTYTFTWNDSGNNSVETNTPTAGYAFQMLFY